MKEQEEILEQEEIIEDVQLSEVEQLKKENAELNEKYLHLYADKENMQKRNTANMLAITKYKDESLAKDLFPIIDDFERCLTSMQKQNQLSEGVSLML